MPVVVVGELEVDVVLWVPVVVEPVPLVPVLEVVSPPEPPDPSESSSRHAAVERRIVAEDKASSEISVDFMVQLLFGPYTKPGADSIPEHFNLPAGDGCAATK
jgi:hypothetical protein